MSVQQPYTGTCLEMSYYGCILPPTTKFVKLYQNSH